MNKKWYVVENTAEEQEVAIVELTEDEAKAIKKFLDTKIIVVPAEYVGYTEFFIDKPYNTKEEAVEAVRTCDYYK